jgi:NIMA (never in mitosis gene a)-related kinase
MRKSDNKIYAMKRVKISKMSRKEISDTLNEVRFLASIRHPSIVAFYEAFIDNNDTELCLIMEYCGCGDLSQKIERYKKKRQYISEPRIWGYIIQLLLSLQELHSHGICHRDLKAANTFLAEDGSVKVGDMNVSKQLRQGQLKTQIGTPYYMAPEIWNNQPYNEKCDIWSLGCMLYEVTFDIFCITRD